MRTFSAAGVVITGLVALVAGGCASVDDAQEPTSSAAPSASPIQQDPSPEAAYDAWLAALSDHDAAAACSHLAPDFTIKLRHAAILEDRAELGDPCIGFVTLL